MRLALATCLALLAAALAPALAGAQSGFTPPEQALTHNGPTGRYLLNGTWRMKRDRDNRGVANRWFQDSSNNGWRAVQVPNAWNAGNYSPASMGGGIAWYRKEFTLPESESRLSWKTRFEYTRYRATVWLNGKRVGSHAGGYVPFEVNLSKGLKRSGTNRLVVRVDNRPRDLDIPPKSLTLDGLPNGGWWNYGGLLGDVYLRRVDRVDIQDVRLIPRLACRTCDATIEYRVTVENRGERSPVTVRSNFGTQEVALGTKTVGAGRRTVFGGTTTIEDPRLWSPNDPELYPVSLAAEAEGGGSAAWTIETGIRQIEVRKGRLLLNKAPVNFRGGFFHQDSPAKGGASDPARMKLVIDRLKGVGGTLLRTHYPLDPQFHQLADRRGVLIWSEIPVYQMDTELMRTKQVRAGAKRMMRENILSKATHPSVLTWSIANELDAEPRGAERRYFREMVEMIEKLDPSRPASLVILGYPAAPCAKKAYRPLKLLGVNTYFGWYAGPSGSVADRRRLSPFLDRLRSCYPGKAIANTEFGAEANRDGPAEERGTYQFQAEWNDYTLGVYAQKPWISGVTGMLMNFLCRPDWSGGNPRPTPPMHAKGVFNYRGDPKLAAQVMSDWYHATQQYDLPGP